MGGDKTVFGLFYSCSEVPALLAEIGRWIPVGWGLPPRFCCGNLAWHISCRCEFGGASPTLRSTNPKQSQNPNDRNSKRPIRRSGAASLPAPERVYKESAVADVVLIDPSTLLGIIREHTASDPEAELGENSCFLSDSLTCRRLPTCGGTAMERQGGRIRPTISTLLAYGLSKIK